MVIMIYLSKAIKNIGYPRERGEARTCLSHVISILQGLQQPLLLPGPQTQGCGSHTADPGHGCFWLHLGLREVLSSVSKGQGLGACPPLPKVLLESTLIYTQ